MFKFLKQYFKKPIILKLKIVEDYEKENYFLMLKYNIYFMNKKMKFIVQENKTNFWKRFNK